MRVVDILDHFLSRADWVDKEATVDRVIIGDPNADFDRCAVTWMPSMACLRRMIEMDVRFLICHEPTFWNHRDDKPEHDVPPSGKKEFIQDNGITVLRNHDAWDRWPDIGIPHAWAQHLGLGNTPVAMSDNQYQHGYDIEPVALDEFAKRVASACVAIGEPRVQVTGDGDRMVSRVGIGTGCCCDIPTFVAMDCDCSIVCDDGSCYWAGIQRARDTGHPVIRVNHGTSEEPGMVSLTQYINDSIDGLSAEHIPHGSMFRLVP